MSLRWKTVRPVRGLVADVENSPGTYGGGDYTHPHLTAIACQFTDDDVGFAWVLDRRKPQQMRKMAKDFAGLWEQADFIVGHNFRRHDIKIIDGFFTMLDLPLPARKKIVDTYLDQPKMVGFSRSLENLAARWDCPEQKISLSEYDWQRAYDGIPAGLKKMRERVKSDVRINLWLYETLIEKGLLKF